MHEVAFGMAAFLSVIPAYPRDPMISPMGMELLSFAGVLAVGQFSPGPDMVLLTQTSLRHGKIAGWWTTLGITTGLMVHAAIALAGFAVIGHWPAGMQAGMRVAAAGYLVWLARGIWRDAAENSDPVGESGMGRIPAGRFFRRGLLCNLTNPKALVFFVALVAPFSGPSRPDWWPLALWLVLVIEGVVLWGAWVAVLQQPAIRRFYHRASLAINRVFALLMLVLAGVLVVEAIRMLRG